MRLVFLGMPGVGKGTQAQKLSVKLNCPHISTGVLLRKAVEDETPIGLKIKLHMSEGRLVPDCLVFRLLLGRLFQEDALCGFILDGFPRSISQAIILDEQFERVHSKLDMVIYFALDEHEILHRITGRRLCPNCNANYHISTVPPKIDGRCDTCEVELYQREDDKEETIKNRLKIFNEESSPLINFYSEKGILREVRADRSTDEIFGDVLSLLNL